MFLILKQVFVKAAAVNMRSPLCHRSLSPLVLYASSNHHHRHLSTQPSNEPSMISDDEFGLEYLTGEDTGIVVFSLRRHKAKNAMGKNILRQFVEGMQAVRHDKSARVVILRSEVPGVFCAGADLKERAKMKVEEVDPYVEFLRGTISQFCDLPMPTIAALDGTAVGGGLEVALACDMRVAADNVKLGLVETSRAILPGGGGTQRLSRLVGPGLAKELIFTSRVIDGTRAYEIGLANQVVPHNEAGTAAYEGALELAREIIPNGPVACRMAKAAISHGSDVDLTTGLKFEAAYYAQLTPTKDRIEGLVAFQEKRKPLYKGH